MLFDLLFNSSAMTFESKIIIFFTFAFAAIFALTIHEFAHSLVAYKLGDPTPKAYKRLTINPLAHFDYTGLFCFICFGFGWAKPVPINPFNFKHTKRDLFFTSMSGIFANLICCFVIYPLFILLQMFCSSWGIAYTILFYVLLFLFQLNLVFLVFNLLPIFPLDGFNAIATFLKYDNKFIQFMHKYGNIILIGVIIVFAYTDLFSILVSYVGYPISAFWNLIFFGVA